jgi:signal transduction histidine kinase
MRSLALSRLAAGLAHDVKNPLNAMALQIAILADKLADAGPMVSEAVASHLASLKEQIARVNEAVRRFADVAEPGGPAEFTDVGSLVADLTRLFGHEARRRRVEIACDGVREGMRSPCDPVRVGRLLMGLFWRALSETPPGGRLAVRAALEGGQVVVRLEHTPGPEAPELAFVTEVVASSAADLGGRLVSSSDETGARFLLRLPKDAEP